jgi:hypothetical protein
MNPNTTYQEIKKLYESGVKKINVTYKSKHRETIRLFKSSYGELCRFKKGSSTKGYSLASFLPEIESFSEVTKYKSDEQKWIDQLNKIKSKLIQSGLWSYMIKDIDKALKIGYTKMNNTYSEYWQIPFDDARHNFLIQNYPEFISVNEKGDKYFDNSFLWTWTKMPKVEKMRFHKDKDHNAHVLNIISEHMKEEKEYTTYGNYQYDISFSYDPLNKKAFYSKEFRGCGNGHYYIALDSTHAMFIEKD